MDASPLFAQPPSPTEYRLKSNTCTPRTKSQKCGQQDGGTPGRNFECPLHLAEVYTPTRRNGDSIGIDLARPVRGHDGHGVHSFYATRLAMQSRKTRAADGAHWEPQGHTNIEGRHLGLRATAVGTRSNARREAIVCSLKAGAECRDVGGREAGETHVCARFTRPRRSTKDSARGRTHPHPRCAFGQKEGAECRGAGMARE